MIWVNLIALIVLFFSFIGGLKEGAVKNFFSLIALIIAIPLAGVSYHLVAAIISFLPGEVWEHFIGLFVALGLIIGGALNILNAAIGMVVFTLLIGAHPIIGWLERAVIGSGVLTWLVVHLSFVQAILPEVFQNVATTVVTGPVLSLVNQI